MTTSESIVKIYDYFEAKVGKEEAALKISHLMNEIALKIENKGLPMSSILLESELDEYIDSIDCAGAVKDQKKP